MKNYYDEIDRDLSRYEGRDITGYELVRVFKICDRIEWCWKFRKITENQFNDLTSRMCTLLDR